MRNLITHTQPLDFLSLYLYEDADALGQSSDQNQTDEYRLF